MPWGISILCRVARSFIALACLLAAPHLFANTISNAGIDVYVSTGGSVLIEQPGRSSKVCTNGGAYT